MKKTTTLMLFLCMLLISCSKSPNDITQQTSTTSLEPTIKQQTTETPTLGKSPDYKVLMEYEERIRQFDGRITNIKNEIEWSDDDIAIQKEKTLLLLSELDEIKTFIDTNREALITGEYNPEYEKQKLADKTNQLMKTLLSQQAKVSTVQEKVVLPSPTQKVMAPDTVNEADQLLKECYQACDDAYNMQRAVEQCSTTCYMMEGSAKKLRGFITMIKSFPPPED